MSSPDYCILDGDVALGVYPRLPTVGDMGGAAFVDDDVEPPITEQGVMASDINQMQKLLVRACRMMPKATFDITRNGTLTYLNGFKSSSDLFVAGDVEIEVQDLMHPIYLVTFPMVRVRWPIHRLPAAVVGPAISVIQYNPTMEGLSAIVSQETSATHSMLWFSLTGVAGAIPNYRVRVDIDGEGNIW